MLKNIYKTLIIFGASLLVMLPVESVFAKNWQLTDENVITNFISRQKLQDIFTKQKKARFKLNIKQLSAEFLGMPYKANRLPRDDKKIVVDFTALDCFTYLDYVHALRSSTCHQAECFLQQLRDTRYKAQEINYLKRKHFFNDWVHSTPVNAVDVTGKLTKKVVTVTKQLNLKSDGSQWVPNIPIRATKITYIPTKHINKKVIANLKDGDYIGIYTEKAGLDVTHTGIFIKTKQGAVLRHASSKKNLRKVVDSPLLDYIADKPGIVVYRAIKS